MASVFRRIFLILLVAALAASVSLASAVGAEVERRSLQVMLAAADLRVQHVEPAEVRRMAQADTKLVVVDVRRDAEFKAGHVPGARHIDRGVLEFMVEREIPDKATPIIIYCRSGGRGTLATATLLDMGYTNVKNMAGGFMGWEKAGLPVNTN